MRGDSTIRIRIISGVVLALALVLVVRLYMVQVVHGETYRERAAEQYVRSVSDLFDRGMVYFTTKDDQRVSAATLRIGYTLAVNPTQLSDVDKLYETLNTITPLDREQFVARAGKEDDPYEEVATRLSEDVAIRIRNLDIKGVYLYKDQWRYYPGDTLAAHVIGFVGYVGDTLKGQYGVERFREELLRRNSSSLFVNFFAEIFGNFGTAIFEPEEQKTGDIVLSLEPTVVRALEKELFTIHEEWKSSQTGGIIMHPKTGAIYALSAVPTFNPNEFSSVSNIQHFQNPLVENIYELGSIIKPLTIAAGLDAGVITRNSTYYDAGFLEMDGFKISNFDGKGRGTVSMQEVLNQSLNTGVSYIVKEMGGGKFRTYIERYGFNEKTGVDLPNEAQSNIRNLNNNRDVEYATASFGQGIALSPIAAVRALSALGNGGVLVRPHVATRIVYENGSEQDISPKEVTRVLSEEASEEITRMLVDVVDTALVNGKEKMEHYSVAAKTGTAQIARVGEKGYYDDRYLHSFFGYFPAYDPEFLVFLYTVEPKEVKYASQTLTKPFMNLTRFLLNYYNVPPDR